MAERNALIYGRAWPMFPLVSLEETLRLAGLSIVHPPTQLVMALDSQGDQFSLSPDDLRHAVSQGNCVSFQWWFTDEHDVYCRIRGVGSVSVVELGMEGCGLAELRSIRSALEGRFGSSDESSVGLVFDPQGVTEDYEWDRFFVHGEQLDAAAFSRGFPEVLGVKSCDFERVGYLPSDAAVSIRGNLVICSAGLG